MNNKKQSAEIPWADRFRPQEMSEIAGQEVVFKKGSFLHGMIEKDALFSLIFWGPPGSGKTSLAFVIANKTGGRFINFSAATSGVPEMKKEIEKAKKFLEEENQKTILFIDEIHRFNKRQQDVLLPYVEKGTVILVGATTENPSFEVNAALLSRSKVVVLKRIDSESMIKILDRVWGMVKKEKLAESKNKIRPEVFKLIASMANGDARTAINTLQMAVQSGKEISLELIKEIFQKSHLFYDKSGEEHFNIISALHKSMRGGDADAAVYWLARMLEGGEEPLYIARRLVRFASEDIGMANNSALMLAVSVYQACHFLGLPECNVHLAHCVIYLAKSKKSVAAYKAIKSAKDDVVRFGNLPVPLHIRNAPTKLMRDLGYSKGYQYSPDHDWKENQDYFPDRLKKRKYL
jgi:putative ATPase